MELDFIQILAEHMEIIVVLAALMVGYALKHATIFKRLPNNDIPLILMVFSAVLNAIVGGLTVENIVYGGLMGLASTGLHQSFKRLVESNTEEE